MVQRMIGHHRQILEDSDVVQRLKSMLYGQSEGARLASIQCLSQLILKPEGEAEHVADQTDVHDRMLNLGEASNRGSKYLVGTARHLDPDTLQSARFE